MRSVTILGATGSVGRSTLDLIGRDRDSFEIVALTARKDVEGLIELARDMRPGRAVIGDERHYPRLREGLAGTGVEAFAGDAAIVEAAGAGADWTMAAIVGTAGLEPTLAAARRGADIALANKECLVSAGELFVKAVAEGGGQLIPVDSEHSAIFQSLEDGQHHAIERIVLTASGGPFRTWTREQMAGVTADIARAHPNWSMGLKISIGSASVGPTSNGLAELSPMMA